MEAATETEPTNAGNVLPNAQFTNGYYYNWNSTRHGSHTNTRASAAVHHTMLAISTSGPARTRPPNAFRWAF